MVMTDTGVGTRDLPHISAAPVLVSNSLYRREGKTEEFKGHLMSHSFPQLDLNLAP